MALQGIFFPRQIPTAEALGAFGAAALTDGALDGCAITYADRAFTVGAGFLIVGGRVVCNPDTAVVEVTGSGAFAALTVTVDTSEASTETEFAQASFGTATGASLGAVLGGYTQGAINRTPETSYTAWLAAAETEGSAVTCARRATAAHTRRLLWQNPNPATLIHGTAVYIPGLADYNELTIVWQQIPGSGATNQDSMTTTVVVKPGMTTASGRMMDVTIPGDLISAGHFQRYFVFDVNAETLTVSQCEYTPADGSSSGTTRDDRLIPQLVLGSRVAM